MIKYSLLFAQVYSNNIPCNIEINRKDLPLLFPYCIIYGQPLIARSRVFSTRSCALLHGYYIKAAYPSQTISKFYDRNKPYQLSPTAWVPFHPTLWEELSFLFIMADYWIVVDKKTHQMNRRLSDYITFLHL